MDYKKAKDLRIAFDTGYLEIDEIFKLAADVKALRSMAGNNASPFVVSELFQNPDHIQHLIDRHQALYWKEAV